MPNPPNKSMFTQPRPLSNSSTPAISASAKRGREDEQAPVPPQYPAIPSIDSVQTASVTYGYTESSDPTDEDDINRFSYLISPDLFAPESILHEGNILEIAYQVPDCFFDEANLSTEVEMGVYHPHKKALKSARANHVASYFFECTFEIGDAHIETKEGVGKDNSKFLYRQVTVLRRKFKKKFNLGGKKLSSWPSSLPPPPSGGGSSSRDDKMDVTPPV